MSEQLGSSPGRLLVISGPSGVGKGTVVDALLRRRPDLVLSVSATTRPRRAREVHGTDYHFLSEEDFDSLLEQGGLLEWAPFNRHRYGTLAEPVEAALRDGRTVVLEIDVKGARQVRERLPAAVLVFLSPPDPGELERRLRNRGTEPPDEVVRRLEVARGELDAASAFDHVVVNRVVEEAVEEILRILDEPSATSA